MEKLNNRICKKCKHFYIDNITANCEKLCLICNDDNPACKYFEPKTNGDRIRAMSDEGYVGFMLGIEQMKKKLAEKDKEIYRLKHKLNNIKDTLTKYHDVSLSKINAKEAEGVHFFVFKFSSALLEIINDNK